VKNGKSGPASLPMVHPVTIWRGRLSVALDALETAADFELSPVERSSPVETTNVQLPTGDRLQIPTGAETLRLKSYLVMCRNTTRDFAEFAELVDSMETHTAAVVLASMDRYYCGDRSRKQWVATQLVRRLADPQPSDEHDTRMSGPEAEADWAKVRERCLSVAVAMLEEAR
jgi:heme transporter